VRTRGIHEGDILARRSNHSLAVEILTAVRDDFLPLAMLCRTESIFVGESYAASHPSRIPKTPIRNIRILPVVVPFDTKPVQFVVAAQ
jgi:hypothetical protein